MLEKGDCFWSSFFCFKLKNLPFCKINDLFVLLI
jgi:hypothetical protein